MRLLDIRPGEGRKFTFLLLHSFCNGTALAALISTAPSLFLQRFGPGKLPWCYMASALVVPAAGYAYIRLAKKLSVANLLKTNLAFVLGGLLLLRFLLFAGFDRPASAVMITWVDAQVVLLALEFDALTGSLFDLRQSKRIFPLIGIGEVVAGILGGLGVPLITPTIGVENLLWVSVVGIGGAFAILSYLAPNLAQTSTPSDLPEPRSRVRARLAPLSVVLIVTAALADLASYFGDNIFYTQLSSRFANADQTAGFIGMYMAGAGALALLSRLFITPFLFQRVGVSAGLAFGPILTFCISVSLCLLLGGYLPGGAVVFWSATCLKLNDDVHRKSNHRTGIFLLLQALPGPDRIKTQAIQEGVVGSMIGGVAGALLLVLNKWSSLAAPWTLALIAFCWALWILRVRKPYAETVASSLRRQLVVSGNIPIIDATSRNFLKSYLRGNDPALILYAIHQLGHAEISPADLEKLLTHSANEVRLEAAEICSIKHDASLLPFVRTRLDVENDPGVIGELLHAAIAISPKVGAELAIEKIHAADRSVRHRALTAIFRANTSSPVALAALKQLAASADAAERVRAAKVIEESSNADLAELLFKLLTDPEAPVRRAAIRASSHYQNNAVTDALVENLTESECQLDAIAALRSHGSAAVQRIQARWPAIAPDSIVAQTGLIRALGALKSHEAEETLWTLLKTANLTQRSLILSTFAANHVAASPAQEGFIRALFHEDTSNAVYADKVLEIFAPFPPNPVLGLVRTSLAEDRKRALERALSALGMLYPTNAFAIVKPYILETQGARRGLAIEAIENILNPEDRGILIPAICEPAPSRARRDTALSNRVAKLLHSLHHAESTSLSTFTQFLVGEWLLENSFDQSPKVAERQAQLFAKLSGPQGFGSGLKRADVKVFLDRLALFSGLRFFHGVSLPSLIQVVREAQPRQFNAGARVINMGDSGHSLFVITAGRVKVHTETTDIVELGVGGIIGEMSTVDPAPRAASVTAIEPVLALELDRENLLELIRKYSDLSRAILSMLAERLRNVNDKS